MTAFLGALWGALKRIPWQVWAALALAIAWHSAIAWHQHKIERLLHHADAAGYARAVADGRSGVAKIEQHSEIVSSDIRSKTNEAIQSSARSADALRVRGPGAATCLNSIVPVSRGGHDEISGGADASLAGLSDPQRPGFILLPFGETVDRAEIADANRSEVLAWREWHRRLTEDWAHYQAQILRLKG